ncbi:hypothetical protein D9M68_968050 [compost metagenome]
MSARKPLASTSPSAEFCSSWLTTSAPGTPLRDTMMASSSSFGGAILTALRLMNRSMTRAMPRTEQMMRGQIGQPAACMMENKSGLQTKAACSAARVQSPGLCLTIRW